MSFFPEASAPLPLTREPLPTSHLPPPPRCMWHSVSKHEKHEYEVVCSNHPIKYWMSEPTVLDQNYFKLFVHYLRDFLPTFLAIFLKIHKLNFGVKYIILISTFLLKIFFHDPNIFFIIALRDFSWHLRDFWKCLTIILSYETFLTFEYAKITQFCHFFIAILIIQGEGVNSMFVNF